jgi:hypothetical protein
MRILYFNLSNGISGDMVLGSLVNAGVPKDIISKLPKTLQLQGTRVTFKHVEHNHLPALSVHVEGGKHLLPREMKTRISRSRLSQNIKNTALNMLGFLIHAESLAHRVHADNVHFHQLAEPDTLIDLVGAALGVDYFRADKIMASAVNAGSLAPASSRILSAIHAPIFTDKKTGNFENATPTGCAILAGLSVCFGALPEMNLITSGYGAGERAYKGTASLFHAMVGTVHDQPMVGEDTMLMETNIDDMDPRVYPYVMDRLLAGGALDVWLTPIQMKKGRPAVQISVLSPPDKTEFLKTILMEETTTLGVRFLPFKRWCLPRWKKGMVKYGSYRGIRKESIEYEDAVKIAGKKHMPLYRVLQGTRK